MITRVLNVRTGPVQEFDGIAARIVTLQLPNGDVKETYLCDSKAFIRGLEGRFGQVEFAPGTETALEV